MREQTLVYQGSASCHLPLGAQLSQHPTAQCLEVVKLALPPWPPFPCTLWTAGTRHDYCTQKACKGRATHRNSVPPGRSELWPRPHILGKQGPDELSAWLRFREPHGGGKSRVRAGGEAFTGQREASSIPGSRPRAERPREHLRLPGHPQGLDGLGGWGAGHRVDRRALEAGVRTRTSLSVMPRSWWLMSHWRWQQGHSEGV